MPILRRITLDAVAERPVELLEEARRRDDQALRRHGTTSDQRAAASDALAETGAASIYQRNTHGRRCGVYGELCEL